MGNGGDDHQRQLIMAGAQRFAFGAIEVLPGLLLMTEVDQTVDVQTDTHPLIERMCEAALWQALNELAATCQVIMLQSYRCPGQIDLWLPVGLGRRAFFEHVDPGFRLTGQHRQQAAPGTLKQHLGVLCQLFQRHTIEPAHELTQMTQAVVGRLLSLQQPDQLLKVFAEYCMTSRFAHHSGVFEPMRGTQVQSGQVGIRRGQALLQVFGE
ncbi:hypothetical protein D3C84_275590 [compost metagenome]